MCTPSEDLVVADRVPIQVIVLRQDMGVDAVDRVTADLILAVRTGGSMQRIGVNDIERLLMREHVVDRIQTYIMRALEQHQLRTADGVVRLEIVRGVNGHVVEIRTVASLTGLTRELDVVSRSRNTITRLPNDIESIVLQVQSLVVAYIAVAVEEIRRSDMHMQLEDTVATECRVQRIGVGRILMREQLASVLHHIVRTNGRVGVEEVSRVNGQPEAAQAVAAVDRMQHTLVVPHGRVTHDLLLHGHFRRDEDGIHLLRIPHRVIVQTIDVLLVPNESLVVAGVHIRRSVEYGVDADLDVVGGVTAFYGRVMRGVVMQAYGQEDRVVERCIVYRVTGVLTSLPNQTLVLADDIRRVEAIDRLDAQDQTVG